MQQGGINGIAERAVDKAGGLKGARCARIASRDKPLTPPALPTARSAMPFMPACCISELKRRPVKYAEALSVNRDCATRSCGDASVILFFMISIKGLTPLRSQQGAFS